MGKKCTYEKVQTKKGTRKAKNEHANKKRMENIIGDAKKSSPFNSNIRATDNYAGDKASFLYNVSNANTRGIVYREAHPQQLDTGPILVYGTNAFGSYSGTIPNGAVSQTCQRSIAFNQTNSSIFNAPNIYQAPTSAPIQISSQIAVPTNISQGSMISNIPTPITATQIPYILPTPIPLHEPISTAKRPRQYAPGSLLPQVSKKSSFISPESHYLSKSLSESGSISGHKYEIRPFTKQKGSKFKTEAFERPLRKHAYSRASSPCIKYRQISPDVEILDLLSSLVTSIKEIVLDKMQTAIQETYKVSNDNCVNTQSVSPSTESTGSSSTDKDYSGDECTNISDRASLPSVVKDCPSFDSFKLSPSDLKYLNEFYKNFTRVAFPLCSLSHLNAARNIILNYALKHGHLLSTVLAYGAFLKWVLSHNPKDGGSYYNYLVGSKDLLSHVVLGTESKEYHIEPLVLNALLLISLTPFKDVTRWKPHLLAIKKLLMQFDWNKEHNTKVVSSAGGTYVLEFCRAWFISIDQCANIPSPYSQEDSSSIDIQLSIPESLISRQHMQRMRLSGNNDFNYIYGHTNTLTSLIEQIYEYARRVNRWRITNTECKPQITLLESNNIFNKLMKEYKHSVISNDKIGLKVGSFKNSLSMAKPLPEGAVEKMELTNGSVIEVPWYDISHQSFVWSAVIVYLSSVAGLTPDHYMMQEAVHKIIDLLIFMNAKEPVLNYSMFILERPVYVAAVNCITFEDRNLISRFFSRLHRMGHISAQADLEDLYQRWGAVSH